MLPSRLNSSLGFASGVIETFGATNGCITYFLVTQVTIVRLFQLLLVLQTTQCKLTEPLVQLYTRLSVCQWVGVVGVKGPPNPLGLMRFGQTVNHDFKSALK